MLPPLRSALLYDRVQVDLDTVSFFDSVEDASCKARNYDVNAAQYDHLSSERRLRRAISCFFDKSAAFADFDISDKGYVSTIGGKRITCGGDGAASCSDSRDRPWTESRLYSEMTSLVFSEIVGHIASCTAQYLEVQLFKLQYSEWGAMLMQQEVMFYNSLITL